MRSSWMLLKRGTNENGIDLVERKNIENEDDDSCAFSIVFYFAFPSWGHIFVQWFDEYRPHEQARTEDARRIPWWLNEELRGDSKLIWIWYEALSSLISYRRVRTISSQCSLQRITIFLSLLRTKEIRYFSWMDFYSKSTDRRKQRNMGLVETVVAMYLFIAIFTTHCWSPTRLSEFLPAPVWP